MHRLLFVAATLAVTMPCKTVAQNLFFSKDGRVVREILSVPEPTENGFSHVRAITYDSVTGKTLHVLDLDADTWLFSVTTDGRFAIVSIDRDRKGVPARILRADLETGRMNEIPHSWVDPTDPRPYASIADDGRLISVYSEDGPEESPMVVTLYDWRTKRRVARQTSPLIGAGGIFGGDVTPDGKIEFVNNRSGSIVIDPKTGRTLISYGPFSVRSPDGTWVVEFPQTVYGERKEFSILNGLNGKPVGKLDLSLTEEEVNWWWQGAFCGASGRFIAAGPDEVFAVEIPTGKKLATFSPEIWKDLDTKEKTTGSVACDPTGKRVAIRSGARLTIHNLN